MLDILSLRWTQDDTDGVGHSDILLAVSQIPTNNFSIISSPKKKLASLMYCISYISQHGSKQHVAQIMSTVATANFFFYILLLLH